MSIVSSPWIVLALVGVIVVFILFSLFKGVIKLLLFLVAAVSAIASWIFLQKNGFTFLSFVTNNPQPWMVQACSWGAAFFVFAVFFHGMSWFSQLFSWHRGGASTGGILTTILMCFLLFWVAMVGVSYYSDVSLIGHYHARASSKATPEQIPWISRLSARLHESPITSWLSEINPMDDPAQTKLACLVAYGCSLDEAGLSQFYKTCLEHSGVPQPSRFLDLFRDKGLRTLVEEGRFVTLLENEHLKTFLQRLNTQEVLEKMQLQ